MEQGYRWSNVRGGDTYRLPGTDHLGRWALVAMLFSLLLHVVLFFTLDHVKIAFGIEPVNEEVVTERVHINDVEVRSYEPENALPPEDLMTPPTDTAALLEEVDLLDLLPKDSEIDISTDFVDPEYALKQSNPLVEGELDALDGSIGSSFDIETSMPEFGRMEEELKPAALGQITVDPGAVNIEDGKMSQFTENLIQKGNQGLVDHGKLDGIKSLDELLNLPANLLLSKKTLLPSDLLFEFNRFELRESAKVGLMKLALLIDKNPNLYCWIEGHSDLIGGEEFNIELSQRRAESVKQYLVNSLRMNPDRIMTRGFGKSQPLVMEGDADAQSPNRRVEIRMRKTPPASEPVKVVPKARPVPIAPEPLISAPKAKPIAEPEPPRAVVVKPRIIPEIEAPPAVPIPKPEPILRAEAVEEELVPRAIPADL